MPDDLVARISAALAAEEQRGDGIEQLWHLDDDRGDVVCAGGSAG